MSPGLEGPRPGAVRTLIADDSLFMRYMLRRELGRCPEIDVVGLAKDGVEAVEMNKSLAPHVVVLDVEMPRLDGLGALSAIMRERPVPVVMFSSYTQRGARVTLEALSLGAVDFMAKPSDPEGILSIAADLAKKIVGALGARPRPSASFRIPKVSRESPVVFGEQGEASSLVVVGASTGGPQALEEVVSGLPLGLGACVVVCQHMPRGFTGSMAKRLGDMSALPVREANEGDSVTRGTVMIAPGGTHLRIVSEGGTRILRTDDGPSAHGVRPSVDVTLRDAAPFYKEKLMVVVMTGMGSDGVEGARVARSLGATVIVQDEASSVVWGMPRAVVEAGVSEAVVPLGQIPSVIQKFANRSKERAQCR